MNASLKLNKKEKGCFLFLFSIILLGFIDVAFVPSGHISQARQNSAMQQSRTIGMALWQYAQDHAGKYPEGKSSTEVFQKLLDGKYASDPSIFFYFLPGKVKPEASTLKPENVGWDVTCCVDATSPDHLPVVFLTGCKIVYQAGARAVPLNSPPRTWSDWWHNTPLPIHFTAVYYAGNNAMTRQHPDADGSFPNFIPADFDPKGKVYHQLTPDGALEP